MKYFNTFLKVLKDFTGIRPADEGTKHFAHAVCQSLVDPKGEKGVFTNFTS